ncbi:hypothetical protein [Methanosarcina mazei]|uniref:Uncharacterized protein n=1 Tax=Methanosarcina mazei TaxID=2209 RepID=A0A0F8FQ64_METMZ|nr:hypothetical protein [Methanosarcina mazei]KKG55177.1 hypothetical protein DU33_19150 [Methanosarcina mazei]
MVKCKEENENENVKKKIKNTHDILGITCPKNESLFHLAFLIIELHHFQDSRIASKAIWHP